MVRDALPLPQVGVDQPVHQLADLALDLLRRVGDDLVLEPLLHAAAIEQVHHPADAHRVVEVLVAAALHLEQDAVDVRHAELEIAGQVLLVNVELPLDVVEHLEIVLQQREPVLHEPGVALDDRRADAERVEQLEMHAPRRVERRRDVVLERLEAAGAPQLRLPKLGAESQPRAHRKDLGAEAEQRARVLGDEAADVFDVARALEDVDLVDDDDDLLAPAAHLLQEDPLGLRERPIGRGHEQDQVGARHELGRDRLVLADDGVGAWGVDDVDFAEQGGRRGDDVQVGLAHVPLDGVAVLQHVDLRGGRRDPFGDHLAAEQRVDEGALAGVELADDDEKEQLVELLDRAVERLLMLRCSVEPGQRRPQPREETPLVLEQLVLGRREDF